MDKEKIVKLYSTIIELAGTQINTMLNTTTDNVKSTDKEIREVIKEIEKLAK